MNLKASFFKGNFKVKPYNEVIKRNIESAIVAIDDLTGIGIADDYLFAPFGAGIVEGFQLIFG